MTDFVLIDDDDLVHQTWALQASIKNVDLKKYYTFDEFLCSIQEHQKEVPIYIDSNLGEKIKGEEVARILFEKGFVNLHLTTGYDPNEFKELDCVLSVIGKMPPY